MVEILEDGDESRRDALRPLAERQHGLGLPADEHRSRQRLQRAAGHPLRVVRHQPHEPRHCRGGERGGGRGGSMPGAPPFDPATSASRSRASTSTPIGRARTTPTSMRCRASPSPTPGSTARRCSAATTAACRPASCATRTSRRRTRSATTSTSASARSAIKGFDYEVAGFYQLIQDYQFGASFSDAGDRSYGRANEVEISGVELVRAPQLASVHRRSAQLLRRGQLHLCPRHLYRRACT